VKARECVLPLKVTSKRQVPEGPVGAKLVKPQNQYELAYEDGLLWFHEVWRPPSGR
jgi:hypothetical protein